VSKPTASLDLKDLVAKGCLVQIEGSKGRNISYKIYHKNKFPYQDSVEPKF
jgi:hypothetical protein